MDLFQRIMLKDRKKKSTDCCVRILRGGRGLSCTVQTNFAAASGWHSLDMPG